VLIIDSYKYNRDKNFGLKSINSSLSITTALRPWLLYDLESGALALNLSVLIIPDIQKIKYTKLNSQNVKKM
jgi:hypothetical protein